MTDRISVAAYAFGDISLCNFQDVLATAALEPASPNQMSPTIKRLQVLSPLPPRASCSARTMAKDVVAKRQESEDSQDSSHSRRYSTMEDGQRGAAEDREQVGAGGWRSSVVKHHGDGEESEADETQDESDDAKSLEGHA